MPVDLFLSRLTVVPAHAQSFVKLIERIGPGGVDHRQSRWPGDQAQLRQLHECFAKRARVAKVPAGDDDPVGDFPAKPLEHPIHDGFLPFQPEGIDAVDEVDPQTAGHLGDSLHGIVEIAVDLQRESAVVEHCASFP